VLKLRTHGALPPCSLYIDIHGSTWATLKRK
jgi:hypothetical protein